MLGRFTVYFFSIYVKQKLKSLYWDSEMSHRRHTKCLPSDCLAEFTMRRQSLLPLGCQSEMATNLSVALYFIGTPIMIPPAVLGRIFSPAFSATEDIGSQEFLRIGKAFSVPI